ncbi:YtxH domain-containing protein [Polluticoccus soli]|uniref:YtxH domain-containing protein n=1 Tax=Polluticoccus soli TaxID=3034150 RepID=UPI0023E18037|nr:YtxH domain-containing protein [Flavipsychrobacter sp. JY13-12]
MKKSTAILLGVAGAAAILYALSRTRKGRELTSELGHQAEEWKDSWTKFAGSTGTRLTHLMESLSHELSGLTHEAREKVLAMLGEKSHNGTHIKN